ncbi:MAG: DUF3631 domain-containing protein [Candidatus Eremiobacteraeota bacterium]|nr:DUF3631 domain-containing protein [Candidatus Eremiobacteraeota bacterium]
MAADRKVEQLLDEAEPRTRASASADDATSDEVKTRIAELAEMPQVEYELARKSEAKRLGLRASALDKALMNRRLPARGATDLPAPSGMPGPNASLSQPDGAVLLGAVMEFVRRYVVLSQPQLECIALWVLHTWAIAAADVTLYLHVWSADKESGKTRLLEALKLLVARPWFTARVSVAVLVRKIAKELPTLLLDEIDAMFKADKETAEAIRGTLNAGYMRSGAVSLCVPEGNSIGYQDFSVFCAKAFAGIGDCLPDTVVGRCARISMSRRRRDDPADSVQRFRRREAEAAAEPIRAEAERWAQHHATELRNALPTPLDALSDRAADCWEPLFAIADRVGGDWPSRARASAVTISAGEDAADQSQGVRLLADIRDCFNPHVKDVSGDCRCGAPDCGEADEPKPHLPSVWLCQSLCEIEESPWGGWAHGKGLNPRHLADMLKPYKIRPKSIRVDPTSTPKGYEYGQFADAWSRLLPPSPEERNKRNGRHNLDATALSENSPAATLRIGGETVDTDSGSSVSPRHPQHDEKRHTANPYATADVADVADVAASREGEAGHTFSYADAPFDDSADDEAIGQLDDDPYMFP